MRASRVQSGALGAPRSVRGGSGRSPVEVTMARNGKKFRAAAEQIEDRYYSLDEAIPLVQRVRFAGFDESVELALRLGVNPKHADQMVRGTIILPHGLGRSRRVLVVASGEKQKEAEDAGADVVGGEEIVERIQAAERGNSGLALDQLPDVLEEPGVYAGQPVDLFARTAAAKRLGDIPQPLGVGPDQPVMKVRVVSGLQTSRSGLERT